jgi:aryl-alcohol dehydrogenase-like predicted oxidoreductase
MERLEYGKTGLEISRLCFGAGHLNNVCASYAEGGELLRAAFDQGITFWDTAEMYASQPHLGAALKGMERSQVVIQTKTGARDDAGARKSIERALREMGTDYIDVLLLHGVSSPEDLRSREGALSAFLDAKREGLIRVIGCSTHIYTGPVMDAVIDHPEIQVILATANKEGRMLEGGPLDRHLEYLQRAYDRGVGISIMKVIAAGHIPESEIEDWIRWGFELETAHAINLGISKHPQIGLNVRIAHEHAQRRSRLRKAA